MGGKLYECAQASAELDLRMDALRKSARMLNKREKSCGTGEKPN